jgi:excisionase family DNA binding protein
MMIEQHYSVAQVASILGQTESTLRRWIIDGKFPALKMGGRSIRIAHSELERWLAKAKVQEKG